MKERAERMGDLDRLITEDDKVKAVAEPSEAQKQPPARVKLGASAHTKSMPKGELRLPMPAVAVASKRRKEKSENSEREPEDKTEGERQESPKNKKPKKEKK